MSRLEPPTDPPMRCHVCDCHIQDGEPHDWDGTGYHHLLCSLQVTL